MKAFAVVKHSKYLMIVSTAANLAQVSKWDSILCPPRDKFHWYHNAIAVHT